jgi:hypothetical protein
MTETTTLYVIVAVSFENSTEDAMTNNNNSSEIVDKPTDPAFQMVSNFGWDGVRQKRMNAESCLHPLPRPFSSLHAS